MRFPLDQTPSPATHTLFSPNTDRHAFSRPSLSSHNDPTWTSCSRSLFQTFTTRMVNDLLLNMVVTCCRTIGFPFTLSVLPPYLDSGSSAIPYLGQNLNDLESLSFRTSFYRVLAKRLQPVFTPHGPQISGPVCKNMVNVPPMVLHRGRT